MPEDADCGARLEARRLVKEFGDQAALHAAMKAERAIEQRDYRRCARWKRVLEILDQEESRARSGARH
jgi:hypothetical protein